MKTFDEIEFDTGTMIHVQGCPFWLSEPTVVLGRAKNLNCLILGRHLPKGKLPIDLCRLDKEPSN